MDEIDSLLKRMDAELETGARRREETRERSVEAAAARERTIELFEEACERLRDVWQPRLEAFAGRFAERVKVTPALTPTRRDVTMVFTTGLASVTLRLSASVAIEAKNLVLDYELHIIPILMDYERHARLAVPLDEIDAAAIGAWIDDRLIAFLKTYHAMFETEAYLERTMVVDPVAQVRFPKHTAACSLERGGRTHYFVSAETKGEFERRDAAGRATEEPAAADATPAAAEPAAVASSTVPVPGAAAPARGAPAAPPAAPRATTGDAARRAAPRTPPASPARPGDARELPPTGRGDARRAARPS